MKDKGFKRVDRTLVVGPRGLPVVSGGYTEIGGVRLYDDELVIGRNGLPELQEGRVEYQRFIDRVNRATDKEIGEALLRAKEARDESN